jgi:hypothetical protein
MELVLNWLLFSIISCLLQMCFLQLFQVFWYVKLQVCYLIKYSHKRKEFEIFVVWNHDMFQFREKTVGQEIGAGNECIIGQTESCLDHSIISMIGQYKTILYIKEPAKCAVWILRGVWESITEIIWQKRKWPS